MSTEKQRQEDKIIRENIRAQADDQYTIQTRTLRFRGVPLVADSEFGNVVSGTYTEKIEDMTPNHEHSCGSKANVWHIRVVEFRLPSVSFEATAITDFGRYEAVAGTPGAALVQLDQNMRTTRSLAPLAYPARRRSPASEKFQGILAAEMDKETSTGRTLESVMPLLGQVVTEHRENNEEWLAEVTLRFEAAHPGVTIPVQLRPNREAEIWVEGLCDAMDSKSKLAVRNMLILCSKKPRGVQIDSHADGWIIVYGPDGSKIAHFCPVDANGKPRAAIEEGVQP